MYVIGGFHNGPSGINYQYDSATDQWTKKKAMPVPAHHEALAAYQGKIYVFGGYLSNPPTGGRGLAGWQPIDNAWEYDPSTDRWKALALLPTKRGSAVAVEVAGKIYVIGGAQSPNCTICEPLGSNFLSVSENDVQSASRNRHDSTGKPPGMDF